MKNGRKVMILSKLHIFIFLGIQRDQLNEGKEKSVGNLGTDMIKVSNMHVLKFYNAMNYFIKFT